MTNESFPFRYYGSRPLEAYEAANDGHFFELCFVRAPEKAALEAIAKLFELSLLDGPVSPARDPWVWAGRWARFAVGERFVSPHAFYARVENLLKAIHAMEPLEQVVNFNVQVLGDNEWERWSLAQQRVPTSGPAYESFSRDVYRSERDSTLKPEPNAPFEAARAAARAGDELSKATSAAKEALAAGEMALIPLLAEEVPPATERSEHAPLRALFAEDDKVRIGPSGRAVALGRSGGWYTSVMFVTDAHALERIELPLAGHWQLHDIDVSADGRHALVAVEEWPSVVYKVLLENGSAEKGEKIFVVPQHGGTISAVRFCGDLAVALTDNNLYLIDPSRFDREPLATVRCAGYVMSVLRDGSLVVVTTFSKTRVIVARVVGRKLKVLARFGTDVSGFEERSGRIVGYGKGAPMYELVNLPPVEEAKPTKAAKTKKSAAPAIELQPTSEPLPPEDPSPDLATVPGAEFGALSPSGRVVGCVGNKASWIVGSGRKDFEAPFPIRIVEVSDDGTRAAFANDGRVVEIDLTSSATLQDVTTTWSDHGALVSCAFTADGTLVALGAKKLLLLADGAIVASATVKGAQDGRYGIGIVRPIGTNLVAFVALKGSERLVVFGVANRRIKALAKFKDPICSIHSRGPRLFAIDSGDRLLEVIGMDASFQAFAATV